MVGISQQGVCVIGTKVKVCRKASDAFLALMSDGVLKSISGLKVNPYSCSLWTTHIRRLPKRSHGKEVNSMAGSPPTTKYRHSSFARIVGASGVR